MLQVLPPFGGAAGGGQTAYVPDGGTLDLSEADPMQQNSVRIESWLPDGSRPFGAVLIWMYGQLSTGLAGPDDIHRATVHSGAEVTVGTHKLHVVAVEGSSPEHPAWLQISLQ